MTQHIKKFTDGSKTKTPDKLIVGTITPLGSNRKYFYSNTTNYLYRVLDKISNKKFNFYDYQLSNVDLLKNSVDEAKIVFFDTYAECDTDGALDEQMTNIILSKKDELLSLLKKYNAINTIYTTSEEATICLRKVVQNIDYYGNERTNQKKALEEYKNNLGRDIKIVQLYSPSKRAINRLGGGDEGIKNLAEKWKEKGFNI